MAFLRAPRGLANTAASGPMRTQTAGLTRVLSDAAICEYRLVTLAEELPITESCEMADAILAETGIAPRVYCNRMLDLPASVPELPATNPAAPFVAAMARVAARQRDGLAALDELGQSRAGPVCRLPLIPTMDPNSLLEALADVLDDALDEAPGNTA